MLSVGGWPSTLWRFGWPMKKLLWKPHTPAACILTECVRGGAAVKLGRSTLTDTVREWAPLVQARLNAPF